MAKVFNARPSGNFADEVSGQRSGANILHLTGTIEGIATGPGQSGEQFMKLLQEGREKLLGARRERVRPLRDDKILADWNGLMIAALARAARAFDEPGYADAAGRCADFILARMRRQDGRLLHRFRDGDAAVNGHLDDYAFLTWGLIELYETTFIPSRLNSALELHSIQVEDFLDEKQGGFFFTADGAEELLARRKEIYDGAVPSGNSVAMLNMLRLGRITADPEFEKRAAALGRAFSRSVADSQSASTMLMCAVDFAAGPSFEVVIAGARDGPDTNRLLASLRQRFIPNKVVLLNPSGAGENEIDGLPEYVRSYGLVNGKAAAYVCREYQCQAPVTDSERMLKMLNIEERTHSQGGMND